MEAGSACNTYKRCRVWLLPVCGAYGVIEEYFRHAIKPTRVGLHGRGRLEKHQQERGHGRGETSATQGDPQEHICGFWVRRQWLDKDRGLTCQKGHHHTYLPGWMCGLSSRWYCWWRGVVWMQTLMAIWDIATGHEGFAEESRARHA